MSQVSKRQLTKKIEEKVFDSFWAVIADLKKKNDVSLFFTDFFTKAERINFAKRMSIAVFLSKGYDYRSIRDMLKVSINTIGRNGENFGTTRSCFCGGLQVGDDEHSKQMMNLKL